MLGLSRTSEPTIFGAEVSSNSKPPFGSSKLITSVKETPGEMVPKQKSPLTTIMAKPAEKEAPSTLVLVLSSITSTPTWSNTILWVERS